MSAFSVRPSMGAVRRPVSRDVVAIANCCSRSFHASAGRLDNQSGSGSTAPSNDQPSRRVRNANAASAINSLQRQRAPPRTPGTGAPGTSVPNGKVITPRKPLISRLPINGATRTGGNEANANRPPGTMVRAPAQIRISRTTGPKPPGGAFKGRRPPPPGTREPRAGAQNRRRTSKADSGPAKPKEETRGPGDYVSDGMLQHLLRLQRKEWDRKAYEPKYAPGSFAANELIHKGRELFRGEVPEVKIWTAMEERIGVVGMHGAEAALQVRRVVDYNDTQLDEFDPPAESAPKKAVPAKKATADKKVVAEKK